MPIENNENNRSALSMTLAIVCVRTLGASKISSREGGSLINKLKQDIIIIAVCTYNN